MARSGQEHVLGGYHAADPLPSLRHRASHRAVCDLGIGCLVFRLLSPIPPSRSYPQSHPLGGVEGPRIPRALYRLEVFGNLSRFRGEGRSAPVYLATTLKDLNHLKLCPELQIEEVLCIHAFARDVYSTIFDQVAPDVAEPRSPSDSPGSSPDPCKPTTAMPSPTSGRQHFMSISLLPQVSELYAKSGSRRPIFRAQAHNPPRTSRACETAIPRVSNPKRESRRIDDVVRSRFHKTRRGYWYSEPDAAQDTRDKTPFVTHRTGLPPLAWNAGGCNFSWVSSPKGLFETQGDI